MWGQFSRLAQTVQGVVDDVSNATMEEEKEGEISVEAGTSEAPGGMTGFSTDDLETQFGEQQKIILQLKDLVREREISIKDKEDELKGLEGKFTKHKLQSKSKITSLNSQLQEAQKTASDVLERASVGSDESISTTVSEASTSTADATLRARLRMAKKKIQDKDKKFAAREEIIRDNQRKVDVKERIIAERDNVIKDLQEQLEQQNNILIQRKQQADKSTDEDGDQESGNEVNAESQMEMMYAQMVYKDRKIIELNNRILEDEKAVLDLQENVHEKDEVIRGRDKAIKLIQKSISEKDLLIREQESLSAKVAAKVERVEEVLASREQQLMTQNEHFNQQLEEQQMSVQLLQDNLLKKEKELEERDKDMCLLIQQNNEQIDKLASIGETDEVVNIMQNKLRDANVMVEQKLNIISALQSDLNDKDHLSQKQIANIKSLEDQLQVSKEQIQLLQENFSAAEKQWNDKEKEMEENLTLVGEAHAKLASEHSDSSQSNDLQLQIQKLHEELQEKDKQLEQLSEVTTAGGGKSASEKKFTKYKAQSLAKIKSLEKKLEGLAQNSDHEEEIMKLKNQMAELEDEKGNLQLRIVELEELAASGGKNEAERLEVELSELKSQMSAIVISRAELMTELQEISTDRDRLQNEYHKAKEEHEKEINEQMLGAQEQLTQLSQEKEIEKKNRVSFEMRLVDFEEYKRHAETDIQSMSSEIKRLTADLEILQENLEKEKDMFGQLEEKKVALEFKVVEIEEQKEGIESQRKDLLKDIEKLKADIEYEKQPNIAFEKENEALEKQLNVQQSQHSKATTHIAKLEDEVHKLLDSLSECKDQKCKDDTEMLLLRDIQVKLKKEISDLSDGSKKDREETEKLTQQLTDHIAEISALQEQIEVVKVQCSISNKKLEEKETEIASFCLKFDCKDGTLQQLAVQLTDLLACHSEQIKSHLSAINILQLQVDQSNSAMENEKSFHDVERLQLSEKIDTLTRDMKVTQDFITEQKEKNDKYKESLTLKEFEADKLQQISMERENKIASLELSLTQNQRQLEMLKDGQTQEGLKIESKMQSLVSQLTEVEQEVSRQQMQITDYESRKEHMEKQFQIKACEMENNMKSSTDEKNLLQKKLSEKETQLATVQEQLLQSLKLVQENEISFQEQIISEKRYCDEMGEKFQREKTTLQQTVDQLQNLSVEKDLCVKSVNATLDNTLYDLSQRDKALNESLQEVDGIKEQITMKDDCIKSLQENITSLQSSADQSSSEASMKILSLSDNLQEMNDQVNQYAMQVDELQKKYLQSEAIITSLEATDTTKDQTITFLQVKLDALENELTECKNIVKKFESNIGTLHTELNGLQEGKMIVEEKISQMTEQSDANLKRKDEEIAEIKGKLDAELSSRENFQLLLKTNQSDLLKVSKALENNIEDRKVDEGHYLNLQHRFQEMEQIVKENHITLQEKEKEISTVSDLYAENKERVKGLEKKIIEKDLLIEKLQTEIKALIVKIDENIGEVEEKKQANETNIALLEDAHQTIGDQRKKLEKFEQKEVLLKTELDEKSKEADNIKSQLDSALESYSQKHAELQNALTGAEGRISDLNKISKAYEEQCGQLELMRNTCEDFASQLHQCKQQQQNTEAQNIILNNTLDEKTSQMQRIMLDLSEKDTMLQNFKEKANLSMLDLQTTEKRLTNEVHQYQTQIQQFVLGQQQADAKLIQMQKQQDTLTEELLSTTNKYDSSALTVKQNQIRIQQMVEEHRVQICDKNNEIQALKETSAGQEDTVSLSRVNLQQITDKLHQTENNLSESQRDLSEKRDMLEQKDLQIRKLSNSLTEKENNIIACNTEIQQFQLSIKTAEEVKENLRASLEINVANFDELKKMLSSKEEELNLLHSDLIKIREEHEATLLCLEQRCRDKVNELSSQVDLTTSFKSQLVEAQEESNVLKSTLENEKQEKIFLIENKCQEIAALVSEVRDKATQLKVCHDDHDNMKKELNLQLEEANATLIDRQNVLEQKNNDLEQATQEIEQCKVHFEKETSILNLKIHEIQKSLDEKENENKKIVQSFQTEIQELSNISSKKEESLVELLAELKARDTIINIEKIEHEKMQMQSEKSGEETYVLKNILSERDLQIENLNETLAQTEERYNLSVVKVKNLSEELAASAEEKNVFKQQLDDLKSNLEKTKILEQAKTQKLKVAQVQFKKIKGELQEMTKKEQEYEEKLKCSKDELTMKNNQVSDIQSRIDKLIKGQKDDNSSLQSLQSNFAENEGMLRMKQAEIEQLSEIIDSMNKEIKDYKNMISDNQESHDAATREIDKLIQVLCSKDEKLNSIMEEMDNLQSLYTNVKVENEKLNTHIELLKTSTSQKDIKIEENLQTIDILKDEIQQETESVISLQGKLSEKEQTVLSLQKIIEENKSVLNSNEASMNELKMETEKNIKIIQEKESYIRDFTDTMDEKEIQTKKYISLIKKLKLELKDLRQNLESSIEVSNQLDAQHVYVTELKTEIEQLTKEKECHIAELLELKKECEQSTVSLQNKCSEIHQLKDQQEHQFIQLKDKLDKQGDQLHSTEIQARNYNEELVALKEHMNEDADKFNNKLTDKDKVIKSLNEQLAESVNIINCLRSNQEISSNEFENKTEAVLSLQTHLHERTAECDLLKSDIISLQTEISHLQESLEKTTSEHKDALNELSVVVKDLLVFQERITEANKEIDELRLQLSSSRRDSEGSNLENLQLENLKLTDDLSISSNKLAQVHDEVDVLKQTVVQLETTIEEAVNVDGENKKSIEYITMENKDLLTRLEEQDLLILTLKKSAESFEIENNSFREEIEGQKLGLTNLQISMQEIEDTTEDKDVEIEALSNRLKTLITENKNITHLLQELRDKCTLLEDDNANLLSFRVGETSKLNALENEVCKLGEDKQKLILLDEKRAQELSDALVEKEEITRQLDRLMSDMCKSSVPVHEQVEVIESPLLGHAREKEIEGRHDIEVKTRLEELQEEHVLLREEFSKVNNKLEVIEVKNEKMLMKLRELKEKNDKLQKEVAVKTNEIESLNIASKTLATEHEKQQHLSEVELQNNKMYITKCEEQLNRLGSEYKSHKHNSETLEAEYQGTIEELQLAVSRFKHQVDCADEEQKSITETFEMKIENLIEEITKKEEQRRKQHFEIESFKEEIGNMKIEFENEQSSLQVENDRLISRLEHLESLHKDADGIDAERKDFDKQYNMLAEDNEHYQELVNTLKNKITILEKEISNNSLEFTTSESEKELIQFEKVQLKDKVQHLLKVESDLKNEIATLEQGQHELHEISNSNQILNNDLTKTKEDHDLLKKQCDSLKDEIDSLTWKIDEFSMTEEELEQTQAKLFEVQSENGKMKRQIRDLGKHSLHEEDLKKLKVEFIELNEQYNNTLVDNTAMIKQLEDLHSQVRNLREAKKNLDIGKEEQLTLHAIEATVDDNNIIRDEMSELQQQKVLLENHNHELEQANKRLEEQQHILELWAKKLEEEIHGKAKVEIEHLRKKTEAVTGEQQNLQTELNNTRSQLSLERREIQRLKTELDEAKDTISKDADALVGVHSKHKPWQTRYNDMKQQYQSLQQQYIQLKNNFKKKDSQQEIHSPACLPSPETASAKSSQTTASPPVEAHFDLSKRAEEAERVSIAAQVETERLNEHSSHLHVILAEERQKTQHLEEALTQAQRRLHQQDHTTASEFKLEMGSEEEEMERLIAYPKTTLTRRVDTYYGRLRRWVRKKSVTMDQLLKTRPRLRTAYLLYLVFIHSYLILGCLLGLV